jgi:hypothetical protein
MEIASSILERGSLKGFAIAEFLLRRDVGSMKKELIAANLTLTDGESTRLWQVYEQYSADMSKINDTRTAILKEYSQEYDTLTDYRDLPESLTLKESGDLPATGTAHQHDDGCAAYIGTSTGPEPRITQRLQISRC